mmetsp:Transcript_8405/g.25207  ORF Transcript_8405/g.25207 Transcript_8405/m.25207 type:complete len:884 (+) Transcript_8405:164-2815(+)
MSLPVGSSPRNPSPLQRATASKAHVLSFPKAGLGTRQQRASWDAGNVSQQQHEAAANNTVPFRRSFAYGDNSSPRSLPPRMQTREKIAPRRVLQGFDLTHAAAPQEPLQRSSSSSNSAGLLTTQLSSSLTKGHATGEAPALDEQSLTHRKQLEQCLEKRAVTPPAERQSARVPMNELLPQLQSKHAVFNSPVVARAYSIASATFSTSTQLQANAATATILADLRLDADTVAAALLYNALDASPLTRDQLSKLLPPTVADMVAATSRITDTCTALQADQTAKEAGTAAKLQTMLLAMADVRAVLVVLAAKLQSLRASAAAAASGAADLRVEAEEGLRVFAPLANRMGVWSVKAELEDLCFLVLNPVRAKELQESLAKPQSRAGLNDALTSLKERLDAIGLVYQDLSGRPKNLYGVHTKLVRKGFFADVRDIHDVRALRLIVDSKQDCYAALREVHDLWDPLPRRFKDYIRTPKENGYQSLHTVVHGPDGLPIEVQVRTAKMHYIAEYGVAAHWRYKEALTSASAHTEKLVGWARYLITWKLELEDGKCRPRGSPPRDTSLASLFPGPAPCGAPGVHGAGCSFPEHVADCRFAKFVQSDRFVPRSPEDNGATPVYVVLLDAVSEAPPQPPSPEGGLSKAFSSRLDAVTAMAKPMPRIREVPAGTTVGDLVSGALPGMSDTSQGRGPLRGLVNHQESDDMAALLTSGDQIELVAADDLLEVLPSPEPLPASPVLRAPPSPKRNIPVVLAPRPTLAPSLVPSISGNILPIGSLSRRLSQAASGDLGPVPARPQKSNQDSARAAAQHPVGSPANETSLERNARINSQRRSLGRLFRGPAAIRGQGGASSSWGDHELDEDDDCEYYGYYPAEQDVRRAGYPSQHGAVPA